MNMAERHEQLVRIRVGTRHAVTMLFADGSTRTVSPVIESDSGSGTYPNLVRVKTEPQDLGTDIGGFEMRSQAIGEVINLPALEELAENEIVFVSGFVVAALEARGEYGYSGKVVSPGKTNRDDRGITEILSWTTVRAG